MQEKILEQTKYGTRYINLRNNGVIYNEENYIKEVILQFIRKWNRIWI